MIFPHHSLRSPRTPAIEAASRGNAVALRRATAFRQTGAILKNAPCFASAVGIILELAAMRRDMREEEAARRDRRQVQSLIRRAELIAS